jgi:hypothetical protein
LRCAWRDGGEHVEEEAMRALVAQLARVAVASMRSPSTCYEDEVRLAEKKRRRRFDEVGRLCGWRKPAPGCCHSRRKRGLALLADEAAPLRSFTAATADEAAVRCAPPAQTLPIAASGR